METIVEKLEKLGITDVEEIVKDGDNLEFAIIIKTIIEKIDELHMLSCQCGNAIKNKKS